MAIEPVTREEKFLASLMGESVTLPDPITRKEMFLAAATGMPVSVPDPITREEMYLSRIKPGEGSGVTIRNQNKTITANGTYRADPGYTGLGTVTVAVPAPECPAPVLEPLTVTENGEYTPGEGVDGFGRVTVEVEGDGLPDGIYAVATGTFTVASQTAMTIEHNLGVIPRVFVVFAENQWFYNVAGNTLILYGAVRFNLANDASYKDAWGTRGGVGTLNGFHYVDLTETTAKVGPNTSTYGFFQPTQNTTADGNPEQLVYRWYAIA